jgi:hypothetical protein
VSADARALPLGRLPHGAQLILRDGALVVRVDRPADGPRLWVHVVRTGTRIAVGPGDVYPYGDPAGGRAHLAGWRTREIPAASG